MRTRFLSSTGRPVTPHASTTSLVTGHFDQYAGYSAYRPNGTPDWLLILTLDGMGRFGLRQSHDSENDEMIARPGDLILLRPKAFQDYGVEQTKLHWELLWTHFLPRPDWLGWLHWPEVALGVMRLRVQRPVDLAGLRSRFADVNRYASGAHLRREALAMNALEELLLWCDELNPTAGSSQIDARIRSAMDQMSGRLDAQFTAADLAAGASLSPSRFAHLFRAQTGTTPQKFLESRRLDRAASLLRVTQLSVKEIAEKVGFASPFYFTLRFKKQTGQSPRAFRRAQKGKDLSRRKERSRLAAATSP